MEKNMATNDLKAIRHKLRLPFTVNGPDWYCETIEALAVEVEELRKIEKAADWAYRFMSNDRRQPDDGEQWEAIAEDLRTALGLSK